MRIKKKFELGNIQQKNDGLKNWRRIQNFIVHVRIVHNKLTNSEDYGNFKLITENDEGASEINLVIMWRGLQFKRELFVTAAPEAECTTSYLNS